MITKIKINGQDIPSAQPYGDPGILLSPTQVASPSTQNHVFQFLTERYPESKEKNASKSVRFVQNMNEYHEPPEGLPIIIREKDLANRQRTMKHFLALNDFDTIPEQLKKKESHPEIQKHASIHFINNISNIASANYVRKKNQGVMLVNELWGRKYHKSILFASGLRKAQHRIKQKSLKVAAERVKAVEKYYEGKHREEIQRERAFLELLVIPVENTESNKELKVMLNTKQTGTPRKSLSIGLNNRRKSFFMPDGIIKSDSPQNSPGDPPSTEVKEIKITPTATPQGRNYLTGELVPKFGTFQQTLGPKVSERSYSKNLETEFVNSRTTSLSNIFDPKADSNFILKRPETEGQIGSPKLTIPMKNLSLRDFEMESPLTKALRTYIHKKAASVSNPTLETIPHKNPLKREISRTHSKQSIRASSPEEGFKSKGKRKKPELRVEIPTEVDERPRPHTVSAKHLNFIERVRSDSKNNIRPIPSINEVIGDDVKKKKPALKINIPKESELNIRPQTVATNSAKNISKIKSAIEYQMTAIPESAKELGGKNEPLITNYFSNNLRSNSSGSAAAFSTQTTFNFPGLRNKSNSMGKIKTEEIDRLKKNFLNLMFYCEDVRDDPQVVASVKETQKSVRDLFRFQDKKSKYKSKQQSQKELKKTVTQYFQGTK